MSAAVGGQSSPGTTACRRCHYDLTGLPVGATACPECGLPIAAAPVEACPACGYDRVGLPPGSACPECGHVRAAPCALCVHWGFDLAGAAATGVCPECGKAAFDTLRSVPERATGTVDGDQACMHCRYNLRGLARSALCPECGHPVEDSIGRLYLAYASPTTLRRLRRGLQLVVIGAGVAGLTSVAGLMFTWVWWVRGVRASASLIGLPMAGMLLLLGHWKLTRPGPASPSPPLERRWRGVLRRAVVAQAAASVVPLAVLAGESAFPLGFGGWLDTAVMAVLFVVGAAGFFGFFLHLIAAMQHASWLARRLADDRLARRARMLAVVLPVVALLLLPLLGLGPAAALAVYLWVHAVLLRRVGAVIDGPRLGPGAKIA